MLKMIDYLLLPRETIELAKINHIMQLLNEGKITKRQARQKVYRQKWKFHHEKIDFLMQVTLIK